MFDKSAAQCIMNLEGNDMALKFREMVDELKFTMPVVTYLRDDAL